MASEESDIEQASQQFERVALFPFPSGVLFPKTIFPLHVVEPQNVAMVRDAIEDDTPIVASLIQQDEVDEHLRPSVHRVAGLGHIVEHHELPDGNYKVLLRGAGRVRILEELNADSSYRQVRAVWLKSTLDDIPRAEKLLETIHSGTMSLAGVDSSMADSVARVFDKLEDPSDIADVMASFIFKDKDERQALLDELDVVRRLETIESRLLELIAMSHADNAGNVTWAKN